MHGIEHATFGIIGFCDDAYSPTVPQSGNIKVLGCAHGNNAGIQLTVTRAHWQKMSMAICQMVRASPNFRKTPVKKLSGTTTPLLLVQTPQACKTNNRSRRFQESNDENLFEDMVSIRKKYVILPAMARYS